MVAKGTAGVGGKDCEFGISRCKLSYIGWINNYMLLCSTRNYIQYTIIRHNRKKYLCITESLCYTAEINIILNKSTVFQ